MQELPATDARGDERRKRILAALHDCIIDKGYPKTTLADVAESAGMTPSHLLYYFRGKDAILEQYFQNVADRILKRIDEFSAHSPERQIDLLGGLFFAGKGINASCWSASAWPYTIRRCIARRPNWTNSSRPT